MRWNRGLDALRAEPGIVVVDASRGWGGWHISGLRDPVAREPRAVLAAAGITPGALDEKWEPYLSLNPELVAARALRGVDSLRKAIQSERILFAPGSANLDQTALAKLTSLAVRYRELEQEALQAGGSARLTLIGRTDLTGADETNATLAEKRVEAVAGWLESSGISPTRLAHNALATAQPLASADSLERARINRSVSFSATFSAGSRGRQ